MHENYANHIPHGFEEHWAIAVRRRWWILGPLFFCWAIVWSASWLLPRRYESEALILVEQQKVPEQYVVPNVTITLQDRLHAITQQILSRTRLQAIIDEFHLYPPRQGLASVLRPRDPVEEMRQHINIELVQSPEHATELTAFKINFSSTSSELAQQINTELTSIFINEDLKSQEELSESTTAFLESQLADARAKLKDQEAKVRAFKMGHLGNLPGELDSNISILSGLHGQLQNTEQGLDAAKQQRLYLQSLIQQYRYRSTAGNLQTVESTATAPEALDKELAELRSRLAEDRSTYTEDHPDIVDLEDRISKTEALKKEVESEIRSQQEAETSTETGEEVGAASPDSGSPTPMMQLQSQLKANDLEIQNYQRREKELESEIASYEARINRTPATEQQLADIARGYEEFKANYDSLLQKQNQSQLATSLERRQQGEQFRVLDPPSLPQKPSAPNHLLFSIGGLILGVGVGCGLTALLEMTNVRIRREKDLKDVVPVRILVAIPPLNDSKDRRFGRVLRWMEAGAALIIFLLIALGNLYAFYKG